MTIRKMPDFPNLTARGVADEVELVLATTAVENFNPALQATAQDGENVIDLFGIIGGGLFEPGPTDESVAAQLRRIGDGDVTVRVNSPGGIVVQGVAIYNLFRNHPGHVTMKVIGVSASIASIVTMAGDRIEIARAGFFFIHSSEGEAIGNRHVMAEAVEALTEFDATMKAVYAARSGLRPADVEAIMDGPNNGGTLMGSDQAVKKGFADALLPADAVKQGARAENPLRAGQRLDKALARAGMSRKERRETLREFTAGTPRAADVTAAQSPADGEGFDAMMARLRALNVR